MRTVNSPSWSNSDAYSAHSSLARFAIVDLPANDFGAPGTFAATDGRTGTGIRRFPGLPAVTFDLVVVLRALVFQLKKFAGAARKGPAWFGQRPDPRRHIDALAVDAALLHERLPEVDPDPKLEFGVAHQLGLYREPTIDCVHSTMEVGERLVPGLLDPLPVVLLDQETNDLAAAE